MVRDFTKIELDKLEPSAAAVLNGERTSAEVAAVALLASAAISLKRVADLLEYGDNQHYGAVRSLHDIAFNVRPSAF